MRVTRVLETCLYVRDLVEAERFYTNVLGLDFYSRKPGRHVFFRCGNSMVLLFNPEVSGESDSTLPVHGCIGAGHVAFATSAEELELWIDQLANAGVAIEKQIEWPGGG